MMPGIPSYHYTYATLLDRQGRGDEAVAQFTLAIQGDPTDSRYYNNLGIALARQGRRKAAIRQFQQALNIDPHNGNAAQNLLRVNPKN